MCGSRLATTARPFRPPARTIADGPQFQELRDPVTSPPLPVPDRFARGQASPKAWPQLFQGSQKHKKTCVFREVYENASRRFETERSANTTPKSGEKSSPHVLARPVRRKTF